MKMEVPYVTVDCGYMRKGLTEAYISESSVSPSLCLLHFESLDLSSSGSEDKIRTLGLRSAWVGQVSDLMDQFPGL